MIKKASEYYIATARLLHRKKTIPIIKSQFLNGCGAKDFTTFCHCLENLDVRTKAAYPALRICC